MLIRRIFGHFSKKFRTPPDVEFDAGINVARKGQSLLDCASPMARLGWSCVAKSVCLLAFLVLTLSVNAQTTNIPNLLPPISSTNATPLGQVENAGLNGYNILKTLSWTNGFTESTLGVYVPSTKAYGAILAVNTAGTNGINYGFFLGGLQNKSTGGFDLYDGGIAVSLSGHENVPVIGEVEMTAETGAVLDLAHPSAGAFNQDIANFYKELYQTSDGNLTIGASVGIGWSNVPQVDGKFYTAGITITDLLKGKHLWGLF